MICAFISFNVIQAKIGIWYIVLATKLTQKSTYYTFYMFSAKNSFFINLAKHRFLIFKRTTTNN